MNPARQDPNVADAVAATVAHHPGDLSWAGWHHNPDYTRQLAAQLEHHDHPIDPYQRAWVDIDYPDIELGACGDVDRITICKGALEHALAHGTWTARHQQVALRFEPRNDNSADRWMLNDWRHDLRCGADIGFTVDIGDTPTRDPYGAPVGIGWQLHQPITEPAYTTNPDALQSFLASALDGTDITSVDATRLDRQLDHDNWHDRARLHTATNDPYHIARWLTANPAGLDAFWDAADILETNTGRRLDQRTASWLICHPSPTIDLIARLPVALVRTLQRTHTPLLRDMFASLTSDVAGGLWDTWTGTIAELVAAADNINRCPAATRHPQLA